MSLNEKPSLNCSILFRDTLNVHFRMNVHSTLIYRLSDLSLLRLGVFAHTFQAVIWKLEDG